MNATTAQKAPSAQGAKQRMTLTADESALINAIRQQPSAFFAALWNAQADLLYGEGMKVGASDLGTRQYISKLHELESLLQPMVDVKMFRLTMGPTQFEEHPSFIRDRG